ncbi:CerR family C-terminal domain-containing protein [Variovorax sp. E3]|uniref:CerR family C-terminal domain-containing protein n=1 Tax=Variovorax sp. E3 TaxID=1914993 RepID=UPI0022B63585|nr:CerR family C-terminal domain-containing protein [Variovorax sp. E3]
MGADSADLVAACNVPGQSLQDTLRICMVSMIDPLKQGEIVRQCIQLHMREMLEPSSRWAKELEHDIKGPHRAIAELLCRHLEIDRADDDIHRLTFAITGLSMQLYVSQDFIEAIRPSLLRTARGIDTWADRLTGYAMALVEAEAVRRRAERKLKK